MKLNIGKRGKLTRKKGWRSKRGLRRGIATIDYFLVLCIILPLAGFMIFAVPRILRLVYEMIITMVDMPFM